jgi:hypothetical protein
MHAGGGANKDAEPVAVGPTTPSHRLLVLVPRAALGIE